MSKTDTIILYNYLRNDMKKMLSLIAILIFVFTLSGCGADYSDTDIKITIPAGSKGEFIYSDEQISTNKDLITLSSDDEFLDTEIILKTIEVKEENAYEPTAFASKTPVDIEIEKKHGLKSVLQYKMIPKKI